MTKYTKMKNERKIWYVPCVFCVYCFFLSLSCLFVISYSASRSVFIGWPDCQSSFWRHDALPIRWCAGCIWGLELIVYVCATPAYLVLLKRGQQSSVRRQLSLDA